MFARDVAGALLVVRQRDAGTHTRGSAKWQAAGRRLYRSTIPADPDGTLNVKNRLTLPVALTWAALAGCVSVAAAADVASSPAAAPVLEAPTLHCLGAYWVVRGDGNRNARVAVACRKAGTDAWAEAQPLFRVEKGKHRDDKGRSSVDVPDDAWLFAGSVFHLEPGVAYDLKLTLTDPDGGSAEKVLHARTMAEPQVAPDAPRRHVVPGTGGGSGTAADPFKGLAAAQAAARPGGVMLLHAGAYEGTFEVTKSGQPGKPIVWQAAGDGEAVLGFANRSDAAKGERVVAASGTHDVWFEGLTIRNATYGVVANDAERVVVRRCHVHGVDYGFACNRNAKGNVTGLFIADNLIEGPSTWPRTKGIEDARGVQVTGAGVVVCYNRIRGFADGVDTFPSPVCAAIDVHNNDVSECTDDGAELDYSQRNTRCYLNRFTNVYQGVSVQPVFGGPAYVYRNALYNVDHEPFKLHNSPSGALFLHNTVVKNGPPLSVYTQEPFSNCVTRNNLFVGTSGHYAFECSPRTDGSDFDYDGWAGGPFDLFLKWNDVRYPTFEQMAAKAPIERHSVRVDPARLFASGVGPPVDPKARYPTDVNDLRLNAGSAAVGAGERLPGLNNRSGGKGPDLGAYQSADPLPHFGPRPQTAANKP